MLYRECELDDACAVCAVRTTSRCARCAVPTCAAHRFTDDAVCGECETEYLRNSGRDKRIRASTALAMLLGLYGSAVAGFIVSPLIGFAGAALFGFAVATQEVRMSRAGQRRDRRAFLDELRRPPAQLPPG